jgi:hypothetical protein
LSASARSAVARPRRSSKSEAGAKAGSCAASAAPRTRRPSRTGSAAAAGPQERLSRPLAAGGQAARTAGRALGALDRCRHQAPRRRRAPVRPSWSRPGHRSRRRRRARGAGHAGRRRRSTVTRLMRGRGVTPRLRSG